MSSELRLKKLRGSGGFVLATVNEEQQRKGNLGGPDLFLAPVGRIESEKISKYYCNTCEKDYVGSPKIEFENPNEEVAENLILIEKGQYLCSTCGSTLAEYREFKKPDEQNDAGLARPLANESSSTQTRPAESVVTIPDFEPQNFDMGTTTMPESFTNDVSSGITSFNSIVGMSVFDQEAKKIGIAKQVGVNSSQSLVLVVTDNYGNDSSIEWNRIKKVGEIILVGDTQNIPSESTKSIGNLCSNCNFENKVDSKFCESCGTKI